MNSSVSYNFDESSNILVRAFKGNVSIETVIASWKDLITNNKIKDSCIGVISDFRQANANVNEGDIYKLKNFYEENNEVFSRIRVAQVVDSPKIIYPMLFEIKFKQFRSKPFSTIDAAKQWIVLGV